MKKEKIVICDECEGKGFLEKEELIDYHKRLYSYWKETCEKCEGSGRLIESCITTRTRYEQPKTYKREELEIKEDEERQFCNTILNQHFELGFESDADRFFKSLMDRVGKEKSNEWLKEIFDKNMDRERIILGILQVLSHLDKDEVDKPLYYIQKVYELTNIEIREYIIRLCEHWHTTECIDFLRNIEFKEFWLKEYQEEIVGYYEVNNEKTS